MHPLEVKLVTGVNKHRTKICLRQLRQWIRELSINMAITESDLLKST